MPLYIIKENIRQNNKEHTARLQSTHHKTIKNIQQGYKKHTVKSQKESDKRPKRTQQDNRRKRGRAMEKAVTNEEESG